MFLIVLIALGSAEEYTSFLGGPSELVLSGHPGIKFANGDQNCRLGVFNDTVRFGLECRETFPFYFDSNMRTHFGASVLTEASLKFEGKGTMNGLDQWALVHQDAFEGTQAEGWSNKTITECSGVTMLGGYCQFSAGETWKEFTELPQHTEVRLVGSLHFIDEWRGETAYIKLGTTEENFYVWTKTYDTNNVVEAENLCGKAEVVEGVFGQSFDVKIKHDASKLLVVFGSTLEEQPCEKSWGVSSLQVFLR